MELLNLISRIVMTQSEQKALEVYPIESYEMYDDLYRQRSIYKKGYQDALDSINSKERILCAAFRTIKEYPNAEIYVLPHREVFSMALGWRHPDIIYKYGDIIDQSDLGGFMTSKGRYVDRKEAAKIAFECGQISEEKQILYSEDIY